MAVRVSAWNLSSSRSGIQFQRNFPREVSENPSILKLSHPILQALDALSGGGKSFDRILARMLVLGIFQHPLVAGRAVGKLCAFGSKNLVDDAVILFDRLDEPDALICNHILRRFARIGDPHGGLGFYFDRMLQRSVPPNHFTFPLLSKLCADLGDVPRGRRFHALTVKLGFESDLFVRNSLIYMYSSFGRIDSAQQIFDSTAEAELNLVTWNSMLDGFVKSGKISEACNLFNEMPERDTFTWNMMIAGYAGIGDMGNCRKLFDEMPERDMISWNSILLGYCKSGAVTLARKLFDEIPKPNLISWNTILAAYVRIKDYRECLTLFDRMLGSGFNPTEATLVSVLTSCSHLGDLKRGKWVHSIIKSSGKKIELDLLLSTSLLTMYTKCGDMDSAQELFGEMPQKGIVAWNSMIIGYGILGRGEKSLKLFLDMEREGPPPNDTTFVCLLSACTHGGLVLEGLWCFDRMVRKYNILPTTDQYGCMVDLLGRAGLLDDSKKILDNMPGMPGASILGALLSSCSTYSNLKLGEAVGSKIMEMHPNDVGSYILMSNIYASEGRWDDVEMMREKMSSKGLLKDVGVSSISYGKCGDSSLGERKVGINNRRFVFSMLSEIGAHMKVSSRGKSVLS